MSDEMNTARPRLTNPDTVEFSQVEMAPPPPPVIVQPMAINVAPTGQPAPVAPAPIASASSLIKIAGLGNLVQSVRAEITGLRTELPALQASAAALRSTVSDLKTQIDSTHDDLKFEATTLGNGSGS